MHGVADFLGLANATGNRQRETRDGVARAYTTASASNRLDAVGAQGRLYDAVGNTLQDGALQSRYDARNRLSETIHYVGTPVWLLARLMSG